MSDKRIRADVCPYCGGTVLAPSRLSVHVERDHPERGIEPMPDQPTPRTEAFTCTCMPLNRRLMAHLLKVDEGSVHEQGCVERAAAQARTEALDVDAWMEIVSDSLAATTEGTDWAEAPEPSDEPGSPYVRRLTNEILARLAAKADR